MQSFNLIIADFPNKIPDMHLFQGKITTTGEIVLIIFIVAVLLFVLVSILNYIRIKRIEKLPACYGDADKLLDEIANMIELGISDRWILKKIAKEMEIAQPSAILLSPQLLVRANDFWINSHKLSSTKIWGTAKLDYIAKRIFGKSITEL